MTVPSGPQPYVPYSGGTSPLRSLFTSTVQVTRLVPSFNDDGGMALAWAPIEEVPDPVLGQPSLLACRLEIGFTRPGKDQLAPLVAGRPPDRVGVAYYDLAADENGAPVVLAGDRLVCVAGPVAGTWEVRVTPDSAQDFAGGHHAEVQVIEVNASVSPAPFPGSPA